MFEFHGWFNIIDAPYFIEDNSPIGKITEQLKLRVNELEWGDGQNNLFINVRQMNGSVFLHVGGNKNHRGVIGTELNELLNWIAHEAPGSFGLLYWRDDEGNPPAGANNFQVKVMARGTVTTRFDPYLSPFFPVLEDFNEPPDEAVDLAYEWGKSKR